MAKLVRSSIAAAAAISAMCIPISSAHAQLGAALAGKTAESIIDDLQQAATVTISNGTSAGNAMMVRAGDQANLLVANLRNQLGDVSNETFSKLSDTQQKMLTEAEKYRTTILSLSNTAYDIRDSTVVDAAMLMQGIPLIPDALFVQRVTGLSHFHEDGDYEVAVYATMRTQNDVKNDVQVMIDGKRVVLSNLDMSRSGVIAFSIPASSLNSKFLPTKIVEVPIKVHLSTTRPGGWWQLHRPQTQSVDFSVEIHLFPAIAGTAVISAQVPTYGWTDAGVLTRDLWSPQRTCHHKCHGDPTKGPNDLAITVSGSAPPNHEGDMRLKNPSLTCDQGDCGYRLPESLAAAVSLTDNATVASAHWETWSGPGHYVLTANSEKFGRTGEATWPGQNVQLPFGQVVTFLIPEDATAIFADITTITGQHKRVALTGGSSGILTFESKARSAPDASGLHMLDRFNFSVAEPNLASPLPLGI